MLVPLWAIGLGVVVLLGRKTNKSKIETDDDLRVAVQESVASGAPVPPDLVNKSADAARAVERVGAEPVLFGSTGGFWRSKNKFVGVPTVIDPNAKLSSGPIFKARVDEKPWPLNYFV